MTINTISTVLLSKDSFYLGEKGQLPKRPEWDKEYITNLVENKVILTSKTTLKDLPPSIIKNAKEVHTDENKQYDINFWIWTFKINSDMFIIIRSTDNLEKWKKFKMKRIFDNYNQIMNINNIEIYFKK